MMHVYPCTCNPTWLVITVTSLMPGKIKSMKENLVVNFKNKTLNRYACMDVHVCTFIVQRGHIGGIRCCADTALNILIDLFVHVLHM